MTRRIEKAAAQTPWDTVAIVFLCGLCTAFSVAKLALALPFIRSSLGLTMAQAGLIAGGQSTVAMTCGAALGLYVAYINERRGLILGMAILAIGSAVGALADDYRFLLGTRVLEGLGLILVIVSAPPFLRRYTAPADTGLVFGIWSIYMALGSAMMIAVAPALLRAWSWRSLWVFASLATAGALLLLLANIRHHGHGAAVPSRAARQGWADLRYLPICLLAMSSLLYVCQFVALLVWLPSALIDLWKVSVQNAAAATAALMLCNAAGSLMGGHLLKKGTRWELILVAATMTLLAALSLATLAMWTAPAVGWTASLVIVFMLAGGFLPPAFLAGVSSHTRNPGQFSCATGLLLQGSHLGQFVGPGAFAYCVDNGNDGWASGLALLCGIAAIGAITGAALFLLRNVRVQAGAAAPVAASR